MLLAGGGIDPTRIRLIGENQGGAVAPAPELFDPDIRGTVMLAGQALPRDAVLLSQLSSAANRLALSSRKFAHLAQLVAIIRDVANEDQRRDRIAPFMRKAHQIGCHPRRQSRARCFKSSDNCSKRAEPSVRA